MEILDMNKAQETSVESAEDCAATRDCREIVNQDKRADEKPVVPLLIMNPVLVSEDYKTAIKGAIKIMDGKYGGGFFARYVINRGTMYSWFNLIIVYPDGMVKSIMLFKNYFKETDTENGNGVCKDPASKKPTKRALEDGNLGNYVQLPQYETPNMPIPAEALWERICKNKRGIPLVYVNEAATTQEIHEALKDAALELSMEYEKGFMVSSDRFLIEKPLFDAIIQEHGRCVCEIRTEFDMLGLFFKDKGKGYQISKKVHGERKRFYAIRNEYPTMDAVGEEMNALEDTSYEWSSDASKMEREVSRMRSELTSMTSKYNVLANKYNKLAQASGIGKVDLEI